MSRNKRPLLDTAAFIEYKSRINNTLLEKIKMSMVVLYELTATTVRKDDFQELNNIRQIFLKRGDLITPAMSDWWETAKLIRRLRFGEKTASRGKTPKLTDAHRLQKDALIARNAYLNDCFMVTTNWEDFDKFVPFMENLVVIAAEDFFS